MRRAVVAALVALVAVAAGAAAIGGALDGGTSTPPPANDAATPGPPDRPGPPPRALRTFAPYRGLWISARELRRLPAKGPAWQHLQSTARADPGAADVADQDNVHGARVFGVALYAARRRSRAARERARQEILAAIGTESEGRTLAAGRNVAPYVLAADLINLPALDPAGDARFRAWIGSLRTEELEDHDRWRTLNGTSDNTASNWGAFATASRIAIDRYLGDDGDLRRAARIHLAYAERDAYPPGKPWGDYFQPTAALDLGNWSCGDDSTWLAINRPCVRDGEDIGGALVEDMSREEDGVTQLPQDADSDGVSYSWETLQALTVQAELLRRAGLPTLWERGDRALLRATRFLQRAGWHEQYSVTAYVPWLVNARYGTTFPTRPGGVGRLVGFTDWTHARRGRGPRR